MPVEFAVDWRSEDRKTVAYINSISDKYQHVVFDDTAEFVYTSFLYYGLYPPEAHQRDAVYKPSGLVITLAKTGKYEFRKVDWTKELSVPGTLFITGAKNVPEQTPTLAVITYPTRPVVLYFDRRIGQFPTTDVAYVILESGHQDLQPK